MPLALRVECDVADFVRQIHGQHRVTTDLFDRLREERGVAWLVELTCLTGQYGLMAGVLNAFEVAPAAQLERLPL